MIFKKVSTWRNVNFSVYFGSFILFIVRRKSEYKPILFLLFLSVAFIDF